jgi:NAD(P)-dependent dehydrogenase (short-subunit alcohol dehydrogenase family)
MRRVVVTGGSGKLGRAVVADLVENGYQVVNLDRTPSTNPHSTFVKVDFTDYGQTIAALLGVDDAYDGVDAVVHLAAIPAPGLTTNAATFDNNIASTYHVFAAARAAKVRTVVRYWESTRRAGYWVSHPDTAGATTHTPNDQPDEATTVARVGCTVGSSRAHRPTSTVCGPYLSLVANGQPAGAFTLRLNGSAMLAFRDPAGQVSGMPSG